MSYNKILNKQRVEKLDYKEMFLKGDSEAKVQLNEKLKNQDVFETEKFSLIEIIPGLGSNRITKENFQSLINNTRRKFGFVFLKLDSDEENKSASINNGLLIRT